MRVTRLSIRRPRVFPQVTFTSSKFATHSTGRRFHSLLPSFSALFNALNIVPITRGVSFNRFDSYRFASTPTFRPLSTNAKQKCSQVGNNLNVKKLDDKYPKSWSSETISRYEKGIFRTALVYKDGMLTYPLMPPGEFKFILPGSHETNRNGLKILVYRGQLIGNTPSALFHSPVSGELHVVTDNAFVEPDQVLAAFVEFPLVYVLKHLDISVTKYAQYLNYPALWGMWNDDLVGVKVASTTEKKCEKTIEDVKLAASDIQPRKNTKPETKSESPQETLTENQDSIQDEGFESKFIPRVQMSAKSVIKNEELNPTRLNKLKETCTHLAEFISVCGVGMVMCFFLMVVVTIFGSILFISQWALLDFIFHGPQWNWIFKHL